MYIRIQISKLPNQATATRKEIGKKKKTYTYSYICTFLAPPAYTYVCIVYHTIVLQNDVYPLPKKHPCGVCIIQYIHTYIHMYVEIYFPDPQSVHCRFWGKCTVHYCFGLHRYIRLVRFASYQLGPGPEMWDLGEISPLPFSLSPLLALSLRDD